MENMPQYVALIQFVGAFNFAFTIEVFHQTITRHFMNTTKKCEDNFKAIHSKIMTDFSTVNTLQPLTSGDGSNDHELQDLKEKYSGLLSQKEDDLADMSRRIDAIIQPNYSRQMFLMIGLYAIGALFIICRIGHIHAVDPKDAEWCQIYKAYNVATVMLLAYLIICEILWTRQKRKNNTPYRMFNPSVTRTFFLFIVVTPVCAFLFPEIGNLAGSQKWSFCTAIILPMAAFIISMVILTFKHGAIWLSIEFKTRTLGFKCWRLARKKENVMAPYRHLRPTSSTFSIS